MTDGLFFGYVWITLMFCLCFHLDTGALPLFVDSLRKPTAVKQ